MQARWVVELMILVLSLSVVMIVWPGMRRFLLGLIRNGVLGLGILWSVGQLLGPQFQVGLNLLTGGICGILGLPGTILLIVVKGLIQ